MSQIDYMKVIDLIANTLNVDGEVNVEASHDKVDIFEVIMKGYDHTKKNCKIYRHKYHLDILFPKIEYPGNSFLKWIPKFEYELEQTFLKNIKVRNAEDASSYILEVEF